MSKYYHGIRTEEEATSLATPIKGTSGLQVIFGTAPVNMADDPSAATNVPIWVEDFDEAKSKLGYSDDWNKYTLCQSMYACFKGFGVAPVIFINVLDPTKHKKAITSTTLNVANKQATLSESGVILSDLVVKSGASALVKNTDYILSFDDNGYVVITLLSSGSGATATTLTVTGNELDSSVITASDIVGGIDAATGKKSGVELVSQIYPKFGVAPGLLLAPGWSKDSKVAAALVAKTEEINGVFECEVIIDLPSTVTKYSDVPAAKETLGITSKHAILMWPFGKVAKKVMSLSAAYGAMVAYTDASNDDVPNLSPSNHLLGVDAVCLADGTEVYLDKPEANTLNAVGVVTAINEGGIKAWGNNTACYPSNTDPKDRWICCRRFFSWWCNTFIISYKEKVDQPANYRLIESFIDKENIKMNSYKAQDKMAGGRIEFRISENPVESILGGHIIFRQHLAAYTPAEDILNILEFDPTILEAAIAGGTE